MASRRQSEAEAAKQAKGAAEAVDEYIGSMCSSDPWMYRTKSEGVVPYDGPDPFGDDEGITPEAARTETVGQLADRQPNRSTHCGHVDDEPGCTECAKETRAYLSGLIKRPVQ